MTESEFLNHPSIEKPLQLRVLHSTNAVKRRNESQVERRRRHWRQISARTNIIDNIIIIKNNNVRRERESHHLQYYTPTEEELHHHKEAPFFALSNTHVDQTEYLYE